MGILGRFYRELNSATPLKSNGCSFILADEQEGFRGVRSTTEQIDHKKHLLHQKDLIQNLIYFKKAFGHIWHEGLRQVTRNYNFAKDLIQVIQALYANSNSVVVLNNQLGELFRTTVGLCQGCPLSHVLFNIFLDNIMQENLQDFNTIISIGGTPICNLRFADDIDRIGRQRE